MIHFVSKAELCSCASGYAFAKMVIWPWVTRRSGRMTVVFPDPRNPGLASGRPVQSSITTSHLTGAEAVERSRLNRGRCAPNLI